MQYDQTFMMKQAENIENFISLNATAKSLAKGKRIAKTISNFGEYEVDMGVEVAEFRIMGTYFYTVIVRNFLGNLQVSCTCPYDWGGICKHEVAALIFLTKYLENNSGKLYSKPSKSLQVVSKKAKKRNSSEPYLIQPYLPLKYSVINSHIGNNSIRSVYGFTLESIHYNEHSIIFELEENTAYWNHNPNIFRIFFSKEGDALSTICSCNVKTEKLCTHQVLILQSIVDNFGADFFEILEPGYVENVYKVWSEKTGLPQEIVKEYYDFDIKSRQFIPNDKATGLVNFNGQNAKNLHENIVAPFKKIESYNLPVEPKDSDKALKMGYVFSFEDSFVMEVVPITGTPSGSEWLKYIKDYSFKNTPLQLNGNDESILSILAELEIQNERNWHHFSLPLEAEELSIQQFYYKKLQSLFGLLEESEFVYFRPSEYSGKIKKSHIIPTKLAFDCPSLFFELGEESIFYTLKAKLRMEDKVLDLSDPALDLERLFPQFLIVEYQNILYRQPSIQQASTIFEMIENTTVFKCVKKDFDPFFEQIVKPISAGYPIEFSKMEEIKHQTISLKPQERQLYISELGSFILFKPVVAYDHEKTVNIRENTSLLVKKENEIITFERDLEYEQEYLEFVAGLHPEFEKQRFNDFFFLPFTALTRNSWFFNVFEKITEEGISVFGINDLKSIQYSPFKASINTHIKSGQDWFDVQIEIVFGDEKIKLSDVRKAIMKNERFVKLSDGKMGLLPEQWFNKLQKIFQSRRDGKRGIENF